MSAVESTITERSMPYGEGRVALLNAVVRLVGRRGLRHLTYRAVAQEAGLTQGTVTHYFGTRDALIHAALEHSLHSSVPAITDDPGSGRLDALFGGLSELVESDPDTQAFQYELFLQARRQPELRAHVDAVYAAYHDALRVELELAGIDAGDPMVHLVFSALEGLVFQQVVQGNPARTRTALAHLRTLLAGLQRNSATGDTVS